VSADEGLVTKLLRPRLDLAYIHRVKLNIKRTQLYSRSALLAMQLPKPKLYSGVNF